MVADALSKGIAKEKFIRHRESMGISEKLSGSVENTVLSANERDAS